MNPIVSIIIPVYNAEKTLQRTVESLVYGEEKNIEIILVDDCSLDNSWKLCQKLCVKYTNVFCVKNTENRGVSYTRNHGLKKANAPYIMFVDSDDWVSTKYVSKMLNIAKDREDALPVCGFYFWDQISYFKTNYIWDNKSERINIEITGVDLFDAVEKIMIQFCWNKIFKKEVIEKNKIRFDESQSMGEDFEFVLDYMLAANINTCLMLNEPLYYYVRANSKSLMSYFGWTSNENELIRIKKLANLSGNTFEAIEKSEQIQKQIKNNWVYHVVRTINKTKKEKLKRIEDIWQDGKSKDYYKKQIGIYRKERGMQILEYGKNIIKRSNGWLERIKKECVVRKMYRKIKISEITIISQNCIGGIFYHDMKIKFLSPTINLYFSANDFVKFVLNLEIYLKMPLKVEWKETWPVGKLGDITIEFMHYNNCEEAYEAWERRKKRIMRENVLILSTDMEGFNRKVFEEWNKIKYPKLLYTSKKEFAGFDGVIYYPEYSRRDSVPDLIPKREFLKDGILINLVNRIGKM